MDLVEYCVRFIGVLALKVDEEITSLQQSVQRIK